MLNADGTKAESRLTSSIAVSLGNGDAVVHFTLSDGDARVIAGANDEDLQLFIMSVTAELVTQVREEVQKSQAADQRNA